MIKKYENKYYLELVSKIEKNNLTIGILGLGYVGLPLALSFCEKKIKVVGFDTNKDVITTLNQKLSHIDHINSARVEKAVNNKFFFPSCDFSLIKNVDAILICVPTPISEKREPNLSYILSSLNSIQKYLREGQILVLESTTYPGTTDGILKPFLEKLKFKIGENFFLIYSPEREDPGNKLFDTTQIAKIIGGDTELCSAIGIQLYAKIIPNIFQVSSSRAAEMTKLLENIFRAVNIGIVNELKELAEKLDIDIFEIIKAASTKPFGFIPFYPGPGVGGHCIPIDPYYLSWKAKQYGLSTKLIDIAGEINSSMPSYVIKKFIELFKNKSLSIKDSKVLILGVTYKKNIEDCREAPGLEIIDQLINLGVIVSYHDPFCNYLNYQKKNNINLNSQELNKNNIEDQDCLILVTDHDQFDYELIEKHSNLLIDTRGRFKPSNKVIRG